MKRAWVFAAITLFFAVRLGAATEALPPEVAALLQKASSEFSQGHYGEASRIYKRLLQKRPDDIDLLKDYLWSEWNSGDLRQSLRIARRIVELDPKDLEGWGTLVRGYIQIGDDISAFAAVQHLLHLSPTSIPGRFSLAKLYEDFRDYPQAERILERLLGETSDVPEIYPRLARVYYLGKKYAPSAKAWAKAVALFPDKPTYLRNQAMALYFSGQKKEGLAVFQRLLQNPDEGHIALDFMMDDTLIRGDVDGAIQLMKDNIDLRHPRLNDGDRIFRLAMIYFEAGDYDRCLKLLDMELAIDPHSAKAFDLKAGCAIHLKRFSQAIEWLWTEYRLNLASPNALSSLAEAYGASGQPAKALKILRQALAIDPTNPRLQMREADFLHILGDPQKARDELNTWLVFNSAPAVPTLLYHGIVSSEEDPELAHNIHVPRSVFASHMAAIARAGYQPITADQLAGWYLGENTLPPKPILITFDDGRLDSLENADPILKQYGLKATMMTIVTNVDRNLPNYMSWNMVRKYQNTGRWEFEAHGDLAHGVVPLDPEGHEGLFLINRQWLDQAHRLETVAEWEERIRSDHENDKKKIYARTGRWPRAFAFPEGEYGQNEPPNSPEAAEINIRLVSRAFVIAFHQDGFGFNNQTRDRRFLTRVEFRREQTGDDVLHHLQDENPAVMMHQDMIRWALWDHRIHEAFEHVEGMRRRGASRAAQLWEEARIHAAEHDLVAAQSSAGQALQLAPPKPLPASQTPKDTVTTDMEVQKQIQDNLRPSWSPSFQYQKDNRDRTNFIFQQSLGSGYRGNTEYRIDHLYGSYQEASVPSITDNGIGVGWTHTQNIYNHWEGNLRGHFLSGGTAANDYSWLGLWASRWSDRLETNVSTGRSLINTARALASNITEQDATLALGLQPDYLWQSTLTANFGFVSDSNHRTEGVLEVSRLIPGMQGFKLVGKISLADMSATSPLYYTPQSLQQYQLGFDWPWIWSDRFDCDLRYKPGAGKEQSTSFSLVHDIEASLNAKWTDRFLSSIGYGMENTPTYTRHTLQATMSYLF